MLCCDGTDGGLWNDKNFLNNIAEEIYIFPSKAHNFPFNSFFVCCYTRKNYKFPFFLVANFFFISFLNFLLHLHTYTIEVKVSCTLLQVKKVNFEFNWDLNDTTTCIEHNKVTLEITSHVTASAKTSFQRHHLQEQEVTSPELIIENFTKKMFLTTFFLRYSWSSFRLA